jgi:hypothetical protein
LEEIQQNVTVEKSHLMSREKEIVSDLSLPSR